MTDPDAPTGTPPDAAWFQRVADNSGLVFFILRVQPDLAFEFLSGGMRTPLAGLRVSESPSEAARLLDHVATESQADLDALLTMRPGSSMWIDLEWRHLSGSRVYSRGRVECRQRPDGSVVVEGAMQDVTQLRWAERELRKSEQRHRLLAHNAWDVVWTMGLDGSITYVSPAVERVRGFTPEEAMRQSLEEIHPPASVASVGEYFAKLQAAIENGAEPPVFRGEHEYYRKDGSIMTGELQVIPHVDADGRVVEILGVTRDISERKRLAEADARFRRLMENSNVGMALCTPDGRFAVVNQALCDFFGYDPQTLKTKDWQDLTPAQYRDAQLSEEFAAGRLDTYRVTKPFLHADGQLLWADLSASCLRDSGGQVEYYIAHYVDITAQVQAREQLAISESRNRALADRLQAEMSSAANYIESILPDDLHGTVDITSRYLPAMELGGDGFHYRWLDDDHLKVYLIDVSGHGIRPALLSASVHNLLRSGSLPLQTLLAPQHVLTKLNDLFQMDEQDQTYFTIWYGIYQPSTRTLSYASAGHPPALVLTRDSQGLAVTPLSNPSIPIGVFDDSTYTTQTYTMPTGSQLLLYSDGAYELMDDTQETYLLSNEDFVTLCTTLAARPDWSLDTLVDNLKTISPTHEFDDDCALVLMTVR